MTTFLIRLFGGNQPTSLSLMKLMPKIVVASTKTVVLWLQSMEQEGNESFGLFANYVGTLG